MSNSNKTLEEIVMQAEAQQKEVKLPSLEEQRTVVEKLKQLEAEGKLTPEILENYFGQYAEDAGVPVH